LINPAGQVVYTVYKETDFTTDLTTGPYSESNLARLVATARQAKQKNYAHIIDFAAYAPSYGAPAAFIAVPIFAAASAKPDSSPNVNGDNSNSEFAGVLAVQVPVSEINNVMTGNQNW
jgi:hypothetical protein